MKCLKFHFSSSPFLFSSRFLHFHFWRLFLRVHLTLQHIRKCSLINIKLKWLRVLWTRTLFKSARHFLVTVVRCYFRCVCNFVGIFFFFCVFSLFVFIFSSTFCFGSVLYFSCSYFNHPFHCPCHCHCHFIEWSSCAPVFGFECCSWAFVFFSFVWYKYSVHS